LKTIGPKFAKLQGQRHRAKGATTDASKTEERQKLGRKGKAVILVFGGSVLGEQD
jgi:hypothetical protein